VKTETTKPAALAEASTPTPTAPTLPTPPPADGKWLVGGEQFGPEVLAPKLVQNGDRRDRWSIELTMPKDAAGSGSATP
jgi:hypothetical protein